MSVWMCLSLPLWSNFESNWLIVNASPPSRFLVPSCSTNNALSGYVYFRGKNQVSFNVELWNSATYIIYRLFVCMCVVLWTTCGLSLCPWTWTWNTGLSTPTWRGTGAGVPSGNREHSNDSRTWRSSKTGVWQSIRILQAYGKNKRLFRGKAKGMSVTYTEVWIFT